MSEKPMFFYAGVYSDLADAESDYEAVKALHAGDMIGSYDSAIISKDENGKVKVDKTEKPTQHGGWAGLAAGAAVAVAAPVAMPVMVAAGVDKDAERVEKTVAKATKYATKRVSADADEAEREAIAVMASA